MAEIEGLSLGSFSVDALGRVSLGDGKVAGFGFQWRGRLMRLSVQAPEPGPGPEPEPRACRVLLTARVGRVPTTALAAERRPEAFELARALVGMLPDGWQVQLMADHSLQLQSEQHVPLPATIGALLVPATRFTLTLAPYLDLLDEHAMGMAA